MWKSGQGSWELRAGRPVLIWTKERRERPLSEERWSSRFEDLTHGQSPQTEPRLARHTTKRARAGTEESPRGA
ncbi:Uncharacterized protein HZ326_25135 [Fusarium oxysporum f. sp. albedinis]|nr:Uncharacterized protein HZ326_25135 [Fusarium oxysporum f. sp. albedinis]